MVIFKGREENLGGNYALLILCIFFFELQMVTYFEAKWTKVQQIISSINDFEYSHGHNIMRIFDVLPNIPFITSEMKSDY